MTDYLIKATAFDGMIRAYAARSTQTVEEARRRQDTWATGSAALGRSLTITAMMGAMLKGDQTLTAKIEGNGPLGAIVADGNARGEVRAYVVNPHVDFDLNPQGKLDVARAVGVDGNLSVVKDLGLKDHFTGQVPLVTGEISEDFTYYLTHSEQIPAAVGAGVLINPDYTVLAAGGFIVQVMPEADEDIVDQLEKDIETLPAISKLIEQGYAPEDILHQLFQQTEVNIHEQLPIQFRCQCSKERVERAISSLGNEDIQTMIDEDHGAEANCHFCNETYYLTVDELENLKHTTREN